MIYRPEDYTAEGTAGGSWTMDRLQRANEAAGRYYFSPDTMRFFRSRVSCDIYQGPGGVFFITSERGPHQSRRYYSVRRFDPVTAACDTAPGTEFQEFDTLQQAKAKARRLAKGE